MCKKLLAELFFIILSNSLSAQKIVPIPFGDMESWMVRVVDESGIIGGKTKYIYEIANGDTLFDNTPYVPKVSKWATSSVYAKVSGISKASTTVFAEPRSGNYAARLETRLEHVKVLGIINISALATGTIFLGEIVEPVKDTKNPQSKLMQGIPFTDRPNFIQFDYKFVNGNGGKRMRSTGFSKDDHIPGDNAAEVCVILQKRWEDENGDIYAERIATGWMRYNKNTKEWHNGTRVEINYGDITGKPFFKDYMGLLEDTPLYTRNKSGKPTMINEIGWAKEDTTPTHIIVRFSSGYGGAYIGAPGSMLWIDNVALGYNK